MSQDIENIKSRLNITDVVSSYIKLDKAGINFKARCPFHNEKTPSFMVSPTRDSYHCFGCNSGGDIFSFVQQIEGLSFPEALELLAERAGVELTREKSSEQSNRGHIVRVLESATSYYQVVLKKNEEALKYLHNRGLTDETIGNFRLGLAPEAWASLYEFLKKKGASDYDMDKAGLVIQSGKVRASWYDRFRARIMFPIFDPQGKVIGFSARIFGNEQNRPNEGKYINSPQTSVYDKSKTLYGFDRAKIEMRKKDFCILVEGQMDLLLSHQAGFLNTVAASGTALTDKSLAQIDRLTSNLVMAFDADLAGVEASKRGINSALAMGMEVKIASLPAGLDPADVILKNPTDWQRIIDEAKHVIDFYLETLSAKQTDKRLLAQAVKKEIYPYLKRLIHRTDQAHFITKISQLVDVAEQIIWEDVKNIEDNQAVVSQNKDPVAPKTRFQVLAEELFGLIFYFEHQKNKAKADEVIAEMKDFLKTDFEKIAEEYETRRNELSLKAEIFYEINSNDSLARELIKQFKIEFLKNTLTQTLKLLKKAETAKDLKEIDNLMQKCQYISSQLNQINI